MVTSPHEAAHRIFQDRPKLLTPLFRVLNVPLPRDPVTEVLTADVTEIRPLERRVDSVLRIRPQAGGGEPGGGGFLLAIEAQGRRDPGKAVSWSYYLSYLKAKYGCPALLLVVCHDKATASWAAGPFDLGVEGWTPLTLRPMVLGPGNVPVVLDEEEAARDPAMATFSALTHRHDPDAPAILDTLARALASVDPDSVAYYSEMLDIGLGEIPAREIWRTLMGIGTYFPGRGGIIEEKYLEGRADGKVEGKAEGKAEVVLRILEQRGMTVSDAQRARVADCTDLAVLDRWIDRAFTATRAEEVFTES